MDDAEKLFVDEESKKLVTDLVAGFPWFAEAYDCHVDIDGPLPHLFFWDITRAVVAAFLSDLSGGSHGLDWEGVLGFLEEQSQREVYEVDVVVNTSFLCFLPYPGQPGHALVEHLGPVMAKRFKRIRPDG